MPAIGSHAVNPFGMHDGDGGRVVSNYLANNPWARNWDAHLPSPSPQLRFSIVIPSLAESASLPHVLDSLRNNQRLDDCEVLVVVNQSVAAPEEITQDNRATMEKLAALTQSPLVVHGLDAFSEGRAMPAQHAGVGLARRWGLDLGLIRLYQAGNSAHGVLICLDADSPVAPGYVDAIRSVWSENAPPTAAYCRYEHPLPTDPALHLPAVAYELWLRYLEFGFQIAGSWFAFPTIGSCTLMAARAYAQVGGIEPRKAAEDFHLLRKLAKLSGERPLEYVSGACVYPAARVSDRVPFGTGRAMQRSHAEGEGLYLWVEPASAFLELREFFSHAAQAYSEPDLFLSLPPRLKAFLEQEGADAVFKKFRHTYPSSRQFEMALQHWFDSLRIIRYLNEAARSSGKEWMLAAWQTLLQVDSVNHLDMLHMPVPEAGDSRLDLHQAWLEAWRKKSLTKSKRMI